MESPNPTTHLAPQLDSPPLSPKISAYRGHDEELGTPDKPGSPLPDPGSVQRLASRLNQRIASEEDMRSPAPRRSLSPYPLKLAKEYERQLQHSRTPNSPDRVRSHTAETSPVSPGRTAGELHVTGVLQNVPRSPSPLKKDSRIVDALAAFQDSPQAKSGFRGSSQALSKAKSGFMSSPAGKSDIVPLTMSPKLATRFALKGTFLHSTPKNSPEMHSRRRSNRLSASMPEAFAALREIEAAMRLIEKSDSPLRSQPQRTFNNTSWEPQVEEAELGLERVSAAVISGPVQGYDEEPEEAAPVKHIAKELFPTDGEGEARSPDLGHIVAGNQSMAPASEASLGSQKRPPPLVHPAEDPSTPQKPSSQDADEWEFPQTPGSLTGPVSSKLWACPAVSPLPPPQVASNCPGLINVEGSARRASPGTWRVILGVVTLTALLASTALLGAYALPWLRSSQQTPGPDQELLTGNATSVPKDLNALAIIPPGRGRTGSLGLAGMASSLMEAVRGAIPLPAASLLQLPAALQPAHASADAPNGIAQPHLVAHAPFAAMLAGAAFAVYCFASLALSLMTWRCGNPCCARRGKAKRRHIGGLTMCQRCGQWAVRHGGQFWGTRAARPAWQRLPGGRTFMCLLRDMGLGSAREN